MKTPKSHLKHVSWVLLDQALVSGVNFLTGLLLARYLGLEEYGVFTLAWMTVLFANSIQNATIISPMMSIGAKQQEEEAPNYYGAVLAQQIVFSALSFVLVLVGVELSASWFPQQWRVQQLALPLACVSAAFQMQDFMRRYFLAVSRMTAAFVNDGISYLGQILGLALCYWIAHLNVTVTLWIVAGSSFSAAAIGFAMFGRIAFRRRTFAAVARRHWHFSKWLTASALMQWTSGNLFIIAASAQFGPVAAGAMRATQNIIGVSHILFQGLTNVVPVEAAREYHRAGTRQLRRYLGKVAFWGGTATGLIVLAAGLVPDLWLRLFYGAEYLNYGFLLRWWSAAYFLIFFGVPLMAGLRALEKTRPMFLAYCVMTTFSLAMAVPSVKHFGLHGAMAGILFTQVVLQGTLAFSLWRQLRVPVSAAGS